MRVKSVSLEGGTHAMRKVGMSCGWWVCAEASAVTPWTAWLWGWTGCRIRAAWAQGTTQRRGDRPCRVGHDLGCFTHRGAVHPSVKTSLPWLHKIHKGDI